MPELPEVETVRRELEPELRGRRIVRAWRVAAPAGPKYAGLERAADQTIVAVQRLGKFLVLPLASGDELIIHLGMTGVLGFATRAPGPDEPHLRVLCELRGKPRFLCFRDPRRFGRFLLLPGGDRSLLPTLARIGPEPLEPGFTVAAFARALGGSRSAIKTVLLAQRAVAGVGNIYADEALWRARIHPLRSARSLSRADVARLHGAIPAVLRASLAAQGTTFSDYRTVNGQVGGFGDELDAYGREGEPCHRCRQKLVRIVIGARSTHFCQKCQRFRPTTKDQ